MNVNRVTNTNFEGKLILKKNAIPRKNFEYAQGLLKELVEGFAKETEGKDGTLLVTGITKNPYYANRPFQLNTYFKNGNYTDAIAIKDDGLFQANYTSQGMTKESVAAAKDKLVKLFEIFKEREAVVQEKLTPLKEKIDNLLSEYKETRKIAEDLSKKHKNIEIIDTAQPVINDKKTIKCGVDYNSFETNKIHSTADMEEFQNSLINKKFTI